jgi:hypothetical protein
VAPRFFTPDEANRALDEVRPAAERLVAVRRRLRELERTQASLITAIGGNGGGYAASDLNEAQTELQGLIEAAHALLQRLDDLGVRVKDLDTGLLDFPALRDDEEVELCWYVGEREVAYWHRIGEGFAGRKPVDWGE